MSYSNRRSECNPQKPNIGLGVQDVEITMTTLFPIVLQKDKFNKDDFIICFN